MHPPAKIDYEEAAKRFWIKVNILDEDTCWEWKAGQCPDGYGRFNIGRKLTGGPWVIHASRAAFVLSYGHWPPVVRHTCDNRACCNPKHLLGGTQLENMADMVERGRAIRRKGSTHPRATITEKQAGQIKTLISLKFKQVDIAKAFKVSPEVIRGIQQGVTWRHVSAIF
jgi:hypothetical protein